MCIVFQTATIVEIVSDACNFTETYSLPDFAPFLVPDRPMRNWWTASETFASPAGTPDNHPRLHGDLYSWIINLTYFNISNWTKEKGNKKQTSPTQVFSIEGTDYWKRKYFILQTQGVANQKHTPCIWEPKNSSDHIFYYCTTCKKWHDIIIVHHYVLSLTHTMRLVPLALP